MLKKYIAKFTVDILPSVLATIIGAYIVNHYIVTKPDAPAAAVASAPESAKPGARQDAPSIPSGGITAKGVSEKALLEKTVSERPAVADRPAETASLPIESHRVQPAPREKAVAKAAPAAAPSAASGEAPSTAEEKHDAAELARAAIARLRGTPEPQPHGPEAQRSTEEPRLSELPPTVSPAAPQPLPPPVTISAPASQVTGSLPSKPSYGAEQAEAAERLTPPADIPAFSRPLDLRAEIAEAPPRQRTSVAEDVLMAAKSVFHAVLPR